MDPLWFFSPSVKPGYTIAMRNVDFAHRFYDGRFENRAAGGMDPAAREVNTEVCHPMHGASVLCAGAASLSRRV